MGACEGRSNLAERRLSISTNFSKDFSVLTSSGERRTAHESSQESQYQEPSKIIDERRGDLQHAEEPQRGDIRQVTPHSGNLRDRAEEQRTDTVPSDEE